MKFSINGLKIEKRMEVKIDSINFEISDEYLKTSGDQTLDFVKMVLPVFTDLLNKKLNNETKKEVVD